MSKSVTVTLANDVSDTLDRHMLAINANRATGTRTSKSNYVSESVRAALVRDGLTVAEDNPRPEKPPELVENAPPTQKYEPL
jgi:hypothetical protein